MANLRIALTVCFECALILKSSTTPICKSWFTFIDLILVFTAVSEKKLSFFTIASIDIEIESLGYFMIFAILTFSIFGVCELSRTIKIPEIKKTIVNLKILLDVFKNIY
jgi:hypothetical protein